MKYSLRVKLSFSYAIVALISVVLIMAITNLFLDKYFREYVMYNQEQKNKDVISSISQQYQDNGKWKLARYESESLVLNKGSFDISELIRKIILNFEPEFKNKDIQIVFKGESEDIVADKDKISQVIINLISNALKYTPSGGTVDICVKGAEDITEVSVKDNGLGIPEEDLPFIFERFYRADKSRNRLTVGSGIGFTIVKAITEAHKGYIEVQSKINGGTEFVLSLPKEKNQDE
jgi:signal transduction histidine kinase